MQGNSTLWQQAHDAVSSGDLDSLQNVIERITPVDRTPEKLGALFHSVVIPWSVMRESQYAQSPAIVSYLVSLGADINHRKKNGDTLLYYISYHNQCGSDSFGVKPTTLPYTDEPVDIFEVHRQYLSLAKLVMISGADPNLLYDSIGERRTALWMATDRPDRSLIALLMEHGADPGIGSSPVALATDRGWTDIVELLSR